MKILKKNLVESIKLTENEDEEIATISTDSSIADTALDIEKSVEAASDGELTVEPGDAAKVAIELQDAEKEINSNEPAVMLPGTSKTEANIVIETKLTKILNKCLAKSKDYLRRGNKVGANVLVSGLPGSGKTAGVTAWAKANGIYLHYLDAKDPNLETILNGFPVRDMENGVKNSVTRAYSDALSPLDKHDNCVLFLDEFNRAKTHIRASLLTLINEKEISGNEEGGKHHFDNLLFTVACINPSCSQDKGAERLSDAEKSRFYYSLKGYDSDKPTMKSYLNSRLRKDIQDLDKLDPNYRSDLEEYLRILDIGLYLADASDEDWTFDDASKLPDLYEEQAKMCNQRAMTEGLWGCGGNVKDLIDWLEDGSGFLEATAQDIIEYLNRYTEPTFEELCELYNVEQPEEQLEEPEATLEEPTEVTTTEEETVEDVINTGEQLEDDDDEGFWGSAASTTSSGKVKSEVEVITAANTWIDSQNW